MGLIVRKSVENGMKNVWIGARKVVELMKSSSHAGNPPVPRLASTRLVRPGVFPLRHAHLEDVTVKKDTFATKGPENVFFQTNVQEEK